MPRHETNYVGRRLAEMERSLKALQKGGLGNASIHGGRIHVYDNDGNVRELIGNQGDGSYGSRVIQSPPQPTPAAPILTPGELGAVMAEWDGDVTEGTKPVVHGHLRVLAMFLGDEGQWDPDEASLVGTIRDRDGGATTLALGTTGRWGVAYQMVGADRVTIGPVSDRSEVDVAAHVDTEEIERKLDEAVSDWEAAQEAAEQVIAGVRDDVAEAAKRVENALDLVASADGWADEARRRATSAESRVSDAMAELGEIDWRSPDVAQSIAAALGQFLEIHVEQLVGGKIAAGLLDVDDLAAQIASIIELNATRIIAGSITARELNLEELFVATGFIERLRSAVVEALQVTAETGFIGGVLLEDEAVTARKLRVTNEMVARFAEILHLVADQIDTNSFIAQTGMIGHLEALGITLSNEAAGRRFEVSGDGFRLTDSDTDNVLAQLGNQADDLISLHDSETGEPSITLGQDGGISAHGLTVETDPSLGGKRLAGQTYQSARWHSGESIMSMMGGHVVAHHRRGFDGDSSSNSGNGQSIAHIECDMDPGRLYRIQVHDFQMRDRQAYYLEAFYETSSDRNERPDPPNRFSLTWGSTAGRIPSYGEGHGTTLSFDRVVSFNTTERVRINFVVGINAGGDGTIRFGDLQRHAAHITITDVGPDLGSSGTDLWQGAGVSTASVPAPVELLRQTYPVARSATYTLNTSTGTATRQYLDGEMRFGRWPDGNTYLTVLQFGSWDQPGVPRHAELSFRVGSWVGTQGSIVQVAIPSFTGTPASFDFDHPETTVLSATRNVGRATATQLDLDRELQLEIANREHASVILGGAGWTSSPYPASGTATLSGVIAALSTDISGQQGDDDE